MYVRMYVRLYVSSIFPLCYHCSDLIYHPILTQLHTSIDYDNTSNKFAFQGDSVKVKVKEKLYHHSGAFIY